jgi:hypothetical protein
MYATILHEILEADNDYASSLESARESSILLDAIQMFSLRVLNRFLIRDKLVNILCLHISFFAFRSTGKVFQV